MSRTFTARNSSQEFTRYKANGLGRMYSRRYPIKIAPHSLMYEAGDLWTEITSTSPTFGALMQLHPCLHKPLRGVKQDTLQSLEPKAYRSHAQKMQWPWLPDMISSSQWNTITYHYIYISFYICLHALTWSVSQNWYWIRSNALAQTFLQPAISTPNMSASLGPPETENPYGIPKTKCQENGIVIQASFTRDSSPAGSKMGLPFMTTSTPVTGWL